MSADSDRKKRGRRSRLMFAGAAVCLFLLGIFYWNSNNRISEEGQRADLHRAEQTAEMMAAQVSSIMMDTVDDKVKDNNQQWILLQALLIVHYSRELYTTYVGYKRLTVHYAVVIVPGCQLQTYSNTW